MWSCTRTNPHAPPRGSFKRLIQAAPFRFHKVLTDNGKEFTDRKQETLEPFVLANVQLGTQARTDGWTGYANLHNLGYKHVAVSSQGDQAKTDPHLPMIHSVFGNCDAWLLGTHHGASSKQLQGYLNAFVFRFNRQFWPMVAFDSVLKIAARTEAPIYSGLYQGT